MFEQFKRTFSPRTRGCSGGGFPTLDRCTVFPAHAGMFLPQSRTPAIPVRFPRARGDVPDNAMEAMDTNKFSPRTRGCSGTGVSS